MRRLSDERGAVAVMAAVIIVPLLGFGALVIDVGALYQERRELQNGADAAALAIAADCARGLPECALSYVSGTADGYVDQNAGDGVSAVDGVDLDLPAQEVTVDVSTETPGGASEIAYRLANLFGDSGKQVRARARAAWGSPSSTVTVPLTVEECEFHKQPLDTPVVLTFHSGDSSATTTCAVNPAGQDGPGNFGWLENAGGCEAHVESGTADGDTGNNPECDAAELEALLDTTIAIPIYRSVSGTGSNLTYEIVGFGAFQLTGYRLGGGPEWNRPIPAPCSGDDRCIGGYFTKFVTDVGEIDADAPDFGLSVSKLVPISTEEST